MFRIFLIAAFAILLAQSSFADNENNTIQTLEELNADLKAKKKELEPFDPKDIKVDLESLGLDDVEKKPAEKKEEAQPMERIIPEKPAPVKIITAEELDKGKKAEAQVPASDVKKENTEAKPEEKPDQTTQGAIMSRIQNMLRLNKSDEKKTSEAIAVEVKEPAKEFVNAQKKANIKKRAATEKKKKWDEKKEAERLKKLNELRAKYVEDSGTKNDEDYSENYLTSSENITPKRKNLNRFLLEEAPAAPIMGDYRTKENLHVPLVMTPKERLDILFVTISIGSISAFNEAYTYIKNPNAKNEFGDTILSYAILLKKYPVITSILAKGADPNLPNKLGYTPINLALELQDFRALELLADNKADLDYVDAFGRNYLMHASRIGTLAAVGLLVDHGIDVNTMDNDGFTALAIAYRHKQDVIATYLLKHGANTWVEKPYNPQQQSIIKELEGRWK
jgi:hypothetical protein